MIRKFCIALTTIAVLAAGINGAVARGGGGGFGDCGGGIAAHRDSGGPSC